VSSPSPVAILAVASALPAIVGDVVPEWVMVMPAGTSHGVDGRGPYVLKDPTKVAAQSIQGGRDVAFDYNHQTVFAALHGSPSPASGWIDRFEDREGALFAHVHYWTPAGRAALAAREYRYVSPAFHHDEKTGEVLSIASVGLVNMPNLRELPALNSQLHTIGDSMNKEELARLAAALGLAADATLDKITACAAELKAAAAKPAVTTGTPDPSGWVPMSAFTELSKQVSALATASATTGAQNAVDAAMREGKVTPAMKTWALDYASQNLTGFAAWKAASPVIVAPGAVLTVGGAPGAESHAAGQDDKAVLAVCAQLGITVEQYKKTQGVTTAAQNTGAKE